MLGNGRNALPDVEHAIDLGGMSDAATRRGQSGRAGRSGMFCARLAHPGLPCSQPLPHSFAKDFPIRWRRVPSFAASTAQEPIAFPMLKHDRDRFVAQILIEPGGKIIKLLGNGLIKIFRPVFPPTALKV